ncbi:MAG: DMT family transporter [Bacteroidales bacterium]|jgi:drug/metabolite transporter (DMT)-like permease|nr:DMT family transporter [Bacteroidales bacterium]MCI2121320.1 DMT family transporter [Bacteroidales bacterium]MCI2145930.1 DMT family transporter [Bacteroidales bacterium]
MTKRKNWLFYAIVTTITWGIWGAFSEIPVKKFNFPSTMVYVMWAISMIPCALVALKNINWKLDVHRKSVWLGLATGFLGAGGQLVLFEALKRGPAYIIFPIISLSPIVTILLSVIFLKERVKGWSWAGIAFALVSIFCMSYSSADGSTVTGHGWIVLALIIFLAWGIQAFVMKVANNFTPDAESIFVYMAITAVALIPVAIAMTDFSKPINWGFTGPYLSFLIQILNAVGALYLVYATRYGKAMVVSPLTNALAPVLTVIISLVIYKTIPPTIQIAGIVSAIISMLVLSRE